MTHGSSRRAARTSQLQFREWAILAVSLCVMGIMGGLAIVNIPSALFSRVFSGTATEEVRPRTAAVLVETTPGECRQFSFDNDSGQIHADADGSCNPQSVRDAEPTGTMTRLDAISKSFSGK